MNKIQFQNFFVQYCFSHYDQQKPLYLAGGLSTDPECCYRIADSITEVNSLRASHEEADDRIMYTIQQLYISTMGTYRITVVTQDTYIFVVLLYHLKNNWDGMELFLMKKGNVKGYILYISYSKRSILL